MLKLMNVEIIMEMKMSCIGMCHSASPFWFNAGVQSLVKTKFKNTYMQE